MGIRTLIVVLIVGVAGFYGRSLVSGAIEPPGVPELRLLPSRLEGWQSQDVPMSDNVARVLAADETLHRVYFDAHGRQVSVFVAYFAQQQVNSQIHSPKHCVPGSGWNVVSTEQVDEPIAQRLQSATRMILARNDRRQEMLYWFKTRGGSITGEYSLKWDLIKNSLARRSTDAVFIRYVASDADADAMRDVIAQLEAPLANILGQAGL